MGLARRVSERVVQPGVAPLAIRALHKASSGAETPTDVLDVAYEFSFFGVNVVPWQIRSELEGLLGCLPRAPRAVVEIGTAQGGTLFVLTRCAAQDACVVSVDLRHGDFGGGYPRWRRSLFQSFPTTPQRLTLIEGDSHARETYDGVVAALGGRDVDLLLVDGDHSFDGVRADFETYAPLVAAGGIVAFHDIVPEGDPSRSAVRLLVGGVPAFWAEIRDSYETQEFVADWSQGGLGLGVLRWPGEFRGR